MVNCLKVICEMFHAKSLNCNFRRRPPPCSWEENLLVQRSQKQAESRAMSWIWWRTFRVCRPRRKIRAVDLDLCSVHFSANSRASDQAFSGLTCALCRQIALTQQAKLWIDSKSFTFALYWKICLLIAKD